VLQSEFAISESERLGPSNANASNNRVDSCPLQNVDKKGQMLR